MVARATRPRARWADARRAGRSRRVRDDLRLAGADDRHARGLGARLRRRRRACGAIEPVRRRACALPSPRRRASRSPRPPYRQATRSSASTTGREQHRSRRDAVRTRARPGERSGRTRPSLWRTRDARHCGFMALLTANVRVAAIFVACFAGNPRIFWWFEIVPLTIVAIVGLVWHRRVERGFVRITTRAKDRVAHASFVRNRVSNEQHSDRRGRHRQLRELARPGARALREGANDQRRPDALGHGRLQAERHRVRRGVRRRSRARSARTSPRRSSPSPTAPRCSSRHRQTGAIVKMGAVLDGVADTWPTSRRPHLPGRRRARADARTRSSPR